jgi:hypothetical protein
MRLKRKSISSVNSVFALLSGPSQNPACYLGQWRPKFEARIVHLRADNGHPDLKITQVLRTALSLVKIASSPGTSPAVRVADEHEALVALEQLNALLLRGGFDLNDITLKTAKMTSSKSRRRAA